MASTAPSKRRSRERHQMSQSLRDSFSREAQHVLTRSLLRSMLPDGWDCSRENEHGIESDGLYLRSSPPGNNGDGALRTIRANQSFKMSKLIPIVNSTRPELQWEGNSAHSMTLSAPTLSRETSAETSSYLEYVYYFEVFLIYGTFSIGFDSDNSGGIIVPESIGLHVNGDLWMAGVRIPNWTQPFRHGDTIGCGVAVGSPAKFFFTRNGDEIDPGTVDCRVSPIQMQTPLVPCVGVSSSAETVIRTNFGFNEYRFLWKGNKNVRIICHVTPSSSSLVDDSIRSDEAFLPADLVRGHTISGDTRDVPPTVVCSDEPLELSGHDRLVEQGLHRSTQPRRRSELLPIPTHGSLTAGDPFLSQGSDAESENHGHDSWNEAPDMNDIQNKVLEVDDTQLLDLNDIKELSRELRSATFASDAHHGALLPLVDVSRSNLEQLNETILRATMGSDRAGHDLGELIAVHELLTDAIEAAEKKTNDEALNDQSSHDKCDIFSLLCHLRSQKQKRYDAAWGLLRLTKKGTNEKRCHEIIASGGIKSLLTLFKSSSESTELMLVSALTAVYLLPSLLDADLQFSTSSFIHMGVIECLQFLIQISRESTDIGISSYEIRTASAFAMTNLWFKVLGEKLRSTEILTNSCIKRFGAGDSSQDPFFSRRRRSSVSSQVGEEVDCSVLIDAFTSVAIMAAESEASRKDEEGLGQANRMNVYYEFALIVESICAVEYARPMAMKEGVISLLLLWLGSGDMDLERPAANALRNLTLTQDDYTAGWVHSTLIHEKGLIVIVGQLESGDSRVRLAMAEAISSLTVAPHTRAGIIEARGVKYLVQLLGSLDIQARDEALALAAGNALLRLAMGATCSGDTHVSFICKAQPTSTKERIIDDIIQNGALNSLVLMAKAENFGSLRFLSAQLLCVISEGCKGHTEIDGAEGQLCDAEAVSALGKILSRDITFIRSSVENSLASSDTSDLINDPLSNDFLTSNTTGSAENTIKEVRHVLRGLINILHPSFSREDSNTRAISDTQLKACSQLLTSGGLKSLLWIASMTQDACSKLAMIIREPSFCHDIQIGSFQALACLCPLLLSPNGPTPCTAKWAPFVLSALVNALKKQSLVSITSDNSNDIITDIYIDLLQGLGCLADCEPLKTKIIDELMPHLLEYHRHRNRNVSDAATRVCLTVGLSVESGANDAYLLGDKFILFRSRLIQAMVRDEVRLLLREIWMPALKVTEVRENEEQSDVIGNELVSLFRALCQDQDTAELREKVRQQYINLYDYNSVPASQRVQSMSTLGRKPMQRTMHRSGSYVEAEEFGRCHQRRNEARRNSTDTPAQLMENINLHALSELFVNGKSISPKSCTENFLQFHQFPLNGWTVERDWVMGHCRALKEGYSTCSAFSPRLAGRLNDALRVWFPSALIREEVIPLCGFRPNASFNFRALAMPSGRYFSFRREGRMISQECETLHHPERVHCIICFRNSSFAGEFTESLLQALYLCPIIQGLTFSNDTVAGESAHAHQGSELLPFLARAIPSSVTHLTFDNVLSNNAALSLAHILKSVYDESADEETVGSRTVKGSLHALAITNSPHINQAIFSSIVESISGISSPLQFLRVLDLSGNVLGDAVSARILSIALSPSSPTAIVHLDLSRNDIGVGNAVKRVLQECILREPKLEVLNLSGNDFGEREGELALQLAASLGDVLSKLVSIDLSENQLSGTFLAGLGASLLSNSHLVSLDISSNRFSSSSVNSFLSRLHNMSKSNVSTQLSFVHLGGNVPSLAPNQDMILNEILSANRQRHVSTYLEEQRNAVAQSLESDSDTNALSSVSDITGEPKTDQKMHPAEVFTVLFSAPLVWRDGEHAYHPIEMLDFKLEKSLLWQCFSEASRNIDISFDNATTDRLQAVMTRGCKYLHFSGHGHPYYLTFEDGSGGIHWFNVDQLKALISGGLEDGKPPFDFVFVSACHSALAGHTFVESGVPHVVCCQQESQLMDSAALSFTRAFYLALAFGRTLKDSFEIGKHAVLSSATVLKPDEEMKKFMLLPEDDSHDVPIFNAEEVPEWPLAQKNGAANSSKRDVNDSLPAPPAGFLGREADMYQVLNLVLDRRFVNIVGPTGMGRSSLAAALCHYIDDRKSTLLFDCIYFVKATLNRPNVGKSSPIVSLHNQLVLSGKTQAVSNDADLDELIKEILLVLKQTKSLLVFDKIETLDGTAEAQDFHFFLGQIFEQTEDVSVLVTSNQSIGLSSLVSVGESAYTLGPLNLRNTVKLFAFHCPHLHSSRERKGLLEELASHTLNNRLAEDDEVSEKIKSVLGGGVPAKTFAVAYEMTVEEFEELKNVKIALSSGECQELKSVREDQENRDDIMIAEEIQQDEIVGEDSVSGKEDEMID